MFMYVSMCMSMCRGGYHSSVLMTYISGFVSVNAYELSVCQRYRPQSFLRAHVSVCERMSVCVCLRLGERKTNSKKRRGK